MVLKKEWGRYCVLDDEKAFIEISKGRLTSFMPGFEGLFFTDPEEVLKVAREDKWTLFIIDVNLGTVNGVELYNRISEITKLSRVIFITGDIAVKVDSDIRKKALDGGGIDFIEKPVNWHELAIKIKNHLKIMDYQHDLEEKVIQRTEMLKHADRLATVGTMVSSIVHEVSSPLTFIKTNQEASIMAYNRIKDKIVDDEVRKMVENIIIAGVKDSLKGVKNIEDLMNSFRRFYKQEKIVTVTDIPSVINEVTTLTKFNIKKFCIHFSVNYDSDDIRIECNKQELVQVITNIVNNAIHALEEFERGKRVIGISVKKDGKNAMIVISNNGPKIPDAIVDNIFEPFFTTKSEEKGTGLGLAIVISEILLYSSTPFTVPRFTSIMNRVHLSSLATFKTSSGSVKKRPSNPGINEVNLPLEISINAFSSSRTQYLPHSFFSTITQLPFLAISIIFSVQKSPKRSLQFNSILSTIYCVVLSSILRLIPIPSLPSSLSPLYITRPFILNCSSMPVTLN